MENYSKIEIIQIINFSFLISKRVQFLYVPYEKIVLKYLLLRWICIFSRFVGLFS